MSAVPEAEPAVAGSRGVPCSEQERPARPAVASGAAGEAEAARGYPSVRVVAL